MVGKITSLERIPVGQVHIEGMLELPDDVKSIVLFAHGSGSSRHRTLYNMYSYYQQIKNPQSLWLCGF